MHGSLMINGCRLEPPFLKGIWSLNTDVCSFILADVWDKHKDLDFFFRSFLDYKIFSRLDFFFFFWMKDLQLQNIIWTWKNTQVLSWPGYVTISSTQFTYVCISGMHAMRYRKTRHKTCPRTRVVICCGEEIAFWTSKNLIFKNNLFTYPL